MDDSHDDNDDDVPRPPTPLPQQQQEDQKQQQQQQQEEEEEEPYSSNLDSLEKETSSVLKRFGSARRRQHHRHLLKKRRDNKKKNKKKNRNDHDDRLEYEFAFTSDRRFPPSRANARPRPSTAPIHSHYRRKQFNNTGIGVGNHNHNGNHNGLGNGNGIRNKPRSVPIGSSRPLLMQWSSLTAEDDNAARIIQRIFRRYKYKYKYKCKYPPSYNLHSHSQSHCLPIITNQLQTDAIQESQSRMFNDDGGSTLHLRDAIASAFTSHKFDSVSTLMFHQASSSSWRDRNGHGNGNGIGHKSTRSRSQPRPRPRPRSAMSMTRRGGNVDFEDDERTCSKEDHEGEYKSLYRSGRTKMVSTLTLQSEYSGGMGKGGRGRERNERVAAGWMNKQQQASSFRKEESSVVPVDSLSLRNVKYPGYEKQTKHREMDPSSKQEEMEGGKNNSSNERKVREICFNCWSARCDNCRLKNRKDENGETIDRMNTSSLNSAITSSSPFCERWDSRSLRQNYRSEDIEINRRSKTTTSSLSSLRFAKDRRRRSAIKEHRHPLFMSLSTHVTKVNHRARQRLHLHRWFKSLVDHVKYDMMHLTFDQKRTRTRTRSGVMNIAIATDLRRVTTRMTSCRLQRMTLKMQHLLPKPPVSGNDPLEVDLIHERQYVTTRGEIATSKIISTQPIPLSERYYRMPSINPLPMVTVELERYSGLIEGDNANVAEIITFGSFSKKCIHGRDRNGGSSCSEVILTQNVISPISIVHCNYNMMDSLTFMPPVTPESFIPPHKLEIELSPLTYVERELEHALNHRRIPTIMSRTGIDPNNRHYFGLNRPEQTGEVDDFGFRTSEAAEIPKLETKIDTYTFVPVEDIVSPNTRRVLPTNAANPACGSNYPVLEVRSRINKITDLAHMLDVRHSCTPNKPQTFTVMTNQYGPGKMNTFVVRSWSFVQKKRVAMFRTKDGVPYWYDRRTGGTFWEKPLYHEETLPVKEGGVILGERGQCGGGDFDNHSAYEFHNTMEARSNLRKIILHPHESDDERAERGRAVQRTRPASTYNIKGEGVTRRKSPTPVKNVTKMVSRRRPMSAPIQRTRVIPKIDHDQRKLRRSGLLRRETQIEYEVMTDDGEQKESVDPLPAVARDGQTDDHNVCRPSNVSQTTDMNVDDGSVTPLKKRVQSFGDLNIDSEKLVTSITVALDDVVRQLSSEKDILKLGVGLGMSLGAQGMLNISSAEVNNQNGGIPSKEIKSDAKDATTKTEDETPTSEPCSCDSSEISQVQSVENTTSLLEEEFTMLPYDSTLESKEDPGPLVAPPTSFDPSINIYTATDTATVDFLQVIKRRRTGEQYVDYIPSTPNIPESKPVGRVKPRPAGKDWQTMGFDPWSAGKDLLTVQFVPTMALVPSLRTKSTEDNKIPMSSPLASDPLDFEESADDRKKREAFDRASRYIRHGAFAELDNLLNDMDYAAPIDYEDDVGNTLLMICCQNGNKKMSKLLLRKGCDLNKQNCNGQSCLHYAFGYGFESLGEYLILKGGDDSLLNSDGLTCYEGLRMEDVTNL